MRNISSKNGLFRPLFLSACALAVLGLGACASFGTAVPDNSADSHEERNARIDAVLNQAADEAEASGNSAQSLAILEQMHRRDPKDPVVAVRFAKALREDDQINRAATVLRPVTSAEDADPEALTELAMVNLSLGEYIEAEKLARQAVVEDEKNGRAYLALGTTLDALGHHEQAEIAYRKGLDEWKGDPAPILNNLALNLASQGYLDEAVSVLEKAKKIAPNRLEIERNLRIVRTLRESTPTSNAPTPGRKPDAVAPAAGEPEQPPKAKKEPTATPKAEDPKDIKGGMAAPEKATREPAKEVEAGPVKAAPPPTND